MTTEEMLNLIINEIRDIKTDISDLKSDVSELKAGQARFENRMDRLENKIDKLDIIIDKFEINMDKHLNKTAEQVGKVVDALSAEDSKYAEKINELDLITKWNTHEIVKMLSRK